MQNQSILLPLFVKFKFILRLSSGPGMFYIYPCYSTYSTLSPNPSFSQVVDIDCVYMRRGMECQWLKALGQGRWQREKQLRYIYFFCSQTTIHERSRLVLTEDSFWVRCHFTAFFVRLSNSVSTVLTIQLKYFSWRNCGTQTILQRTTTVLQNISHTGKVPTAFMWREYIYEV